MKNRTMDAIAHRASTLGICYVAWTQEEIDIVKQYYPTEGSHCADKLPRKTKGAIHAMAKKLNISFETWSEREDNIIKEIYPLYGAKKCLEKLQNRKVHNITDRANYLHVYYIDWTSDEINTIKSNEGYRTADEWKVLIPRKSYTAIKAKAKELNVIITAKNNLWTEEEDDIIKKYYVILHGDLENMLPYRTNKNIAQRARKLGIELLHRWTKEDTQFLIDNYLERGAKYCAKCLRRTEAVVKAYARKNGLYQKKRRIMCVELGTIYHTQAEILQKLHINNISKAIKHGITAGGYHWKYIEEE